ncbi:PAS domain S-box protein [Flavihumibacter sp. UBA7668]|uniref:PAS domain S-box protein n=1 Tax=Flavihumibacter sp. UBA7668 TaxID=1946542 RepID=UPI0025B9FC71|nr:PAS domain S-box protein [Flavihumibacter sp. UBA7668]
MRKTFQEIAKQAPVGLCILMGSDFIVEMANDAYLELIDKPSDAIIGKPLFEILPEVKEQVEPILLNVLKTGNPFTATDFEVKLERAGKSQTGFFNLIYQPLRNEESEIVGIIVIASEVTELVLSRQQLEQREKNFRKMVMESPIAMAIIRGPEMIIEMANTSMLTRFWRRTTQEVEGKKLVAVFPELAGQAFPDLIRQVMENGEVYRDKEVEAYVDAKDGRQIFYIDIEYTPLREDINSAVSGVMISAYDVTETVKAKRLAKEAEERLQMAINATGMGNYEVDLLTNEMYYSRGFLEIFGVDPDAPVGRNDLVSRIHPDDLTIRKQAHERSLKTGVLEYEFRVYRKEKELHWLKAWGKVQFDQEGKPIRLTGTILDITEEKSTMLALRTSEQKFRTLADTLPAMVWISDAEGNLYYFNKSVHEYSGYNAEELDKVGWLEIVHPDDREENIKYWMASIQTGEPFLFEHRFRRHDGVYRWQLSRAVPQYNEEGQIEMWVGSSTDIHEHKVFTDELELQVEERTQELKNSNEALINSNTELAQFAYVASHDLQEPLRKIQTFASLVAELEKSRLSEKGAEILQRLRSTAERMQQLVLDLLSYSRVNKMDNHFARTDLGYMVNTIVQQLDDGLEQRKIQLDLDPLPIIWAIPFQMEQLFTNLLSNAIKFSDLSKNSVIQIRYKRWEPGSVVEPELNPAWAYHQIDVEDNGIGFDNSYREKIFQVFQRLHGKESFPGTGIGLAICKKIVDNHQGYISAQGETGQGASFRIYLPDFSS